MAQAGVYAVPRGPGILIPAPSVPNATFRLLSSAAGVNRTQISTGPLRLFTIQGENAAAAKCYFKLWDQTTAPVVGSDHPIRTVTLAPSAQFDVDLRGFAIANSAWFALTMGVSDADASGIGIGDVMALNIDYWQ